jgi:hypothetical protein
MFATEFIFEVWMGLIARELPCAIILEGTRREPSAGSKFEGSVGADFLCIFICPFCLLPRICFSTCVNGPEAECEAAAYGTAWFGAFDRLGMRFARIAAIK